MQHILDYISTFDILSYRLVCKNWCDYINDLLVSDENPVCFNSPYLTMSLIRARPIKIDNYFWICILGNHRRALPVMPRININKYVQYAIKTKKQHLLKELISSHHQYDVRLIIDRVNSADVLGIAASLHPYNDELRVKTTEIVRKNKRKELKIALICVTFACVAITLLLAFVGLAINNYI